MLKRLLLTAPFTTIADAVTSNFTIVTGVTADTESLKVLLWFMQDFSALGPPTPTHAAPTAAAGTKIETKTETLQLYHQRSPPPFLNNLERNRKLGVPLTRSLRARLTGELCTWHIYAHLALGLVLGLLAVIRE